MKGFSFLIIVLIICLSCEKPFETKPTEEDELFVLTHDYDERRIVHNTLITLSWSDVTLENFKKFIIERAYIDDDGPHWSQRTTLSDSLSTSFIDTIDDDLTYQYRLRIVDKNNQFRHTVSKSFTVPKVTSIIVPDDYSSIQQAYDTNFLDSGDSLLVRGKTYVGNFQFFNKDINIMSLSGTSLTILKALHKGITVEPDHTPVYYSPSVVEINRGILDGFTITGGASIYGGGIKVSGSAKIINCVITKNKVINSPYSGYFSYPNSGG